MAPAAQICTSLFWRPKSHCRNRIFEFYASRFWDPLPKFVHGPVSGRLNRAVAPRFWIMSVSFWDPLHRFVHPLHRFVHRSHFWTAKSRCSPVSWRNVGPEVGPAQIRSPTRRLEATKSITNLKGHRNSPHTSQFRTTSPIGVSSLIPFEYLRDQFGVP